MTKKLLKDLKILFIDDEPEILESCMRLMDERVATCECCDSPHEAIELLETYKADTAFIDINMPGKNGLDLMSEIRRIYPDVFCVMLSSNIDFDSTKFAKLHGTDYLQKPASIHDLLIKISEIFTSRGVVLQSS